MSGTETEQGCGRGICFDCVLRCVKELPAIPKVYCWRNGVVALPQQNGSGDLSLVMLGAQQLLELRARGTL